MSYWQPKEPCLYILANARDGTLYTGATSIIYDRIIQHRNGAFAGFTHRYHIHMLVYYEIHNTMAEAITRERRIKKWERAWKVRLIQDMNPEWLDLFDEENGISLPPADIARRKW